MSRPRVINQESILDAAEAVVVRDGAARLTLDAVAHEAGISKTSVLYDFKSKQALIKAVIKRRFAEEKDRITVATKQLGGLPDAKIHGRIAAARTVRYRDSPAVAISLCAALAQDTELQLTLQNAFRQELAEVLEASSNTRGALLAFLALEGLMVLEHLGLHYWPEPTRSEILKEIDALVDAAPRNPPLNKRMLNEHVSRHAELVTEREPDHTP
ncbi:MAG: TetR/AcrR family transcriptional regulator [Chelatococcus sp.]|jgi:AcrR family transcriptional regulator|uniref:TetR/AcrR family transcriptional regulator n=1 Tax=Chelatococcus sp. TaxID=1953771 RepID=UPI0025BBBA36|nr:TetR/AcrR family transcriptional regulator [Chelatococcus sp.]MBX3539786.1 TetR/AcrR family transcriptional regulator [Chelatococcus sp.]